MEFNNSVTTVTHMITDQGNGGWTCDKCKYYKDGDPNVPLHCPNCKRRVIAQSTWVNPGGSDF